MITRVKKVEMDGAEFWIAPLTIAQVEEYVVPPPEGSAVEVYKERTYQMICWSLNNAIDAKGSTDPKWDVKMLRQSIDIPLMEFLQGAILDMSGLKMRRVSLPDEEALGESSAAIQAAA